MGEEHPPQEMINDAQQAKDDPQLRTEFLQKSLNVFTAALNAWFDIEEFRRSDQRYDWTLEELRCLPVKWYGGTDLSKLHDLTATCLFGHYRGVDIIIPHCWFPRQRRHPRPMRIRFPCSDGRMTDGWISATTMCSTTAM